jgi:hypothetical protein
MISESIALEELSQLGCLWPLPESERAQNEVIEAYRDVSLDEQHARRITKHLIQYSRRTAFPFPADIRLAAKAAGTAIAQEGVPPVWNPLAPVCSECQGHRYVQRYELHTKITHEETLDGETVQVFDRVESREVTREFVRSIKPRMPVRSPASWKRAMNEGITPAMQRLLKAPRPEATVELADNEEIVESCLPCPKCAPAEKAGDGTNRKEIDHGAAA